MLPLGHLAGGYIVTKIILSFFKGLTQRQKKRLLLFGTFVTLLPDFDFIYPLFKFGTIFTKRSVFNHHTTIFHILFFWLLVFLIIFFWPVFTALMKKIFSSLLNQKASQSRLYNSTTSIATDYFEKRKFFRIIALVFLGAIFSHLLLDSFFINSGPLWLWPFSQKTYGFIFQSSDTSGFAGFLLYLSRPVFYLEILLGLSAFYLLWKTNKTVKNNLLK